MTKQKRKLVRRTLNKKQSLRAFEARMHSIPIDKFRADLEGRYLSSFDCYDTYKQGDPEIERRYDSFLDNPCFRLAYVCQARDVKILGVTSSKIIRGHRLAALPKEDLERITYVGPHNPFHNYKASEYSLRPEDKRYLSAHEKNILQE